MPIADTELIFPEKRIFLKPLTILQLAVTLIGGLVAAVVTLWGVRCCPYVLPDCRSAASDVPLSLHRMPAFLVPLPAETMKTQRAAPSLEG